MKKALIILVVVLLSFTAYGRVPTKFKGVPLTAPFSELKRMLNKKFTLFFYVDEKEKTTPVYKGNFAGYKTLVVAKSFSHKIAYVAVLIPVDESNWKSIYYKLVNQIKRKYGKYNLSKFVIKYPYTKGDNDEYQAVTSKKSTIYTLWKSNYYQLVVEVNSKGKIMVRYSNSLVFTQMLADIDRKQRDEL